MNASHLMVLKKHKRTAIRRHAFTLVEILVTVLIVSFLAALSFPVIGRINASSMKTRGVNTLRTLQQANLMHAADHDGWSAPVMKNDLEMRRTWWSDNPDFLGYLGLKPGERWPAKMLYPKSASRGPNLPNPDPTRLFGYNYTTLEFGFDVPGHSRRVKLVQVTNPSRTIAFADAVDLQIRFLGADRWRGEEEYLAHAIAYRHPYGIKTSNPANQKAAVVFWDGSAKLLSRTELTSDPAYWNLIAQ